jgi:cation:H+ antiporter
VKGHPDIAVGNAIGSSLFNLLGILGIASIVHPLYLGEVQGEDLGAMIGISVLLLVLIRTKFDLNRWEGGVLLASYVGYLVWLFSRA